MLFLKHGGHILEQDDKTAQALDRNVESISLARKVAPNLAASLARGETTPFDYLIPEIANDPAAHLPAADPAQTVAALKALGAAMSEPTPAPAGQTSTVPPVYTYWGQFLDHDLTANTDRDSAVSDITKPDLKPLDPGFVVANLRNLRHPGLDLDSVYGDGPAFYGRGSQDAGFYEGPRFRIGKNHQENIPGEKIPPVEDFGRDLPRIGMLLDAGVIQDSDFTPEQKADPNFRTRALIGDSRNDENLVIGQLHLAFLRFHNRVVDQLEARGGSYGSSMGFGHRRQVNLFENARRLTRWHYQWLVVNDYLKTVTKAGVVDKVLLNGPKFYKPRHKQLFMPLEYSVAAFRFGHSMIRAAYDHNRNFGKRLPDQGAGAPLIPFASLDLLFAFTGNGHAPGAGGAILPNPFLGQGPTLPFNWVIEWDRFTDKGSADPLRFARKVDTHLAPPLLALVNEGNTAGVPAAISELLKQLAGRNLARGYLLHLPTGQAMAAAMGVPALTEPELRQGNSNEVNAALDQGGFVQTTPLWYYLLKEAEVRANGNTLGELGSRILCETIIGLLRHEPTSYLNQRGWDPADGVLLENGEPIVTIPDFLKFAGVMT